MTSRDPDLCAPARNRRESARIAIVANTGWNMVRFRRDLIEALVAQEWSVTAIANYSDVERSAISERRAMPIHIGIEGSSTNPLTDIFCFLKLCSVYFWLKPDVVHHFSIKPIIYGSLAARIVGVETIVNCVTGLGGAYRSDKRWLSRLVRYLYRLALPRRAVTVFQNESDLRSFKRHILPRKGRSTIIRGSGVDTEALAPDKSLPPEQRFVFVMASRMLWSKGVREFVQASNIVKRSHPSSRFLLFGGVASDYKSKNPDFIPRDWLENLRGGPIEWWGFTDPGVVEYWMRRCAAVVYPSYYPEGVPRSLLEALSAGAPIITTNTPGCRDAILPNVTGFLCAPRSSNDVAAAMTSLLDDPNLIGSMGRAGRRLAKERFDKKIMLEKTFVVYAQGAVYGTSE